MRLLRHSLLFRPPSETVVTRHARCAPRWLSSSSISRGTRQQDALSTHDPLEIDLAYAAHSHPVALQDRSDQPRALRSGVSLQTADVMGADVSGVAGVLALPTDGVEGCGGVRAD